jgi:hypothetical protein
MNQKPRLLHADTFSASGVLDKEIANMLGSRKSPDSSLAPFLKAETG